MLSSDQIKKEPISKVKFWTVIVCCIILTYVQNYVNIVGIHNFNLFS